MEQTARLDATVNGAGILYDDHTHELTLERWNRLITVNLTCTFLMVREALLHLLQAKGRVVANFGMTSAIFDTPTWPHTLPLRR